MCCIGDIMRINGNRFRSKECQVFEDKSFTYEETNRRINQLANFLLQQNIQKGDRIGLIDVWRHQTCELFFACAKIGAVAVPYNYRLKSEELEYVIGNSNCKMIFLGDRYTGIINGIRDRLPSVQQFIGIEADGSDFEDLQSYATILTNQSEREPNVDVAPDDTALVLYTSGTTGLPKGVILSHRNLLSALATCIVEFRTAFGDRVYTSSPPFHIAGYGFSMQCFYVGGTHIILDQFHPEKVLSLIQKEKVTWIFLIPAMVSFIINLDNAREYDLSSVRMLVYGGAPMPFQVLKSARELFHCDFAQSFGQTECAVQVVLKPEDHRFDSGDKKALKRLESIGRPAFNVEVRLVDEDGNDIKMGEIGEIVSRSDGVTRGYWGLEETTKETLKNGWLHTADIARADEDGYLYLVDRKKDIIIRGGENISSAEVERALFQHPQVLEAAVIGTPDGLWGEAVTAVVAVKEGEHVTEEEIIAFCKQKIASYKSPTAVRFIDKLPRTYEGGKVMKTVLREPYWKGREKKV